jgi:antitoxin MazE
MRSRVRKWGNSLAVRIPWGFAKDAGIEDGAEIDIRIQDGDIRIRPMRPPKYPLHELLSQITEDNLHPEVDSGPSQGREAW